MLKFLRSGGRETNKQVPGKEAVKHTQWRRPGYFSHDIGNKRYEGLDVIIQGQINEKNCPAGRRPNGAKVLI